MSDILANTSLAETPPPPPRPIMRKAPFLGVRHAIVLILDLDCVTIGKIA